MERIQVLLLPVLRRLKYWLDQKSYESLINAIKQNDLFKNNLNICDLSWKSISNVYRALELAGEETNDEFIKQPAFLKSIFSEVSLFHSKPQVPHYYPYQTFGNLRLIFPNEKQSSTDVKTHLNHWANQLKELFETVHYEDEFVDQLLAIYNKYAWCIPVSSLMKKQSIALNELLRMAFALRECLAKDDQKLSLLVGDVSGIQKYIFQMTGINGKGSAKRLRARSFYISTLIDCISHDIVYQHGLPKETILVSSGGKFYILLPGDVQHWLTEYQKTLDYYSLNELNGQLIINLSSYSAKVGENLYFGTMLERLNEQLQIRKGRPLSRVLVSSEGWNESLFVRDDIHLQLCPECRQPFTTTEKGCPHCERDLYIGTNLPKVKYVEFIRGAHPDPDGIHLWSDYSIKLHQNRPSNQKGYLIYRLHKVDDSVAEDNEQTKWLTTYIPLAGADGCPHCNADSTDSNVGPFEPLTFDCLAAESGGRSQLGYLKADVDHLGSILTFGLSDQNDEMSIAQFSTLSCFLEYFFAGYLDGIMREEQRSVYTIFSGGDDLFLVGAWDQITEMAFRINKDFKSLVANNENFTLSAAIHVTKPATPIQVVAEIAEEMLEVAKEKPATNRNEGRNQLTLFGSPFSWEEAKSLIGKAKTMDEWKERGDLSASFLYRLKDYSDMFKRYKKENMVEGLKYLPLLTNDIRKVDTRKTDPHFIQWLRQLTDINSDDNDLLHMNVLCRFISLMDKRVVVKQ